MIKVLSTQVYVCGHIITKGVQVHVIDDPIWIDDMMYNIQEAEYQRRMYHTGDMEVVHEGNSVSNTFAEELMQWHDDECIDGNMDMEEGTQCENNAGDPMWIHDVELEYQRTMYHLVDDRDANVEESIQRYTEGWDVLWEEGVVSQNREVDWYNAET